MLIFFWFTLLVTDTPSRSGWDEDDLKFKQPSKFETHSSSKSSSRRDRDSEHSHRHHEERSRHEHRDHSDSERRRDRDRERDREKHSSGSSRHRDRDSAAGEHSSVRSELWRSERAARNRGAGGYEYTPLPTPSFKQNRWMRDSDKTQPAKTEASYLVY